MKAAYNSPSAGKFEVCLDTTWYCKFEKRAQFLFYSPRQKIIKPVGFNVYND